MTFKSTTTAWTGVRNNMTGRTFLDLKRLSKEETQAPYSKIISDKSVLRWCLTAAVRHMPKCDCQNLARTVLRRELARGRQTCGCEGKPFAISMLLWWTLTSVHSMVSKCLTNSSTPRCCSYNNSTYSPMMKNGRQLQVFHQQRTLGSRSAKHLFWNVAAVEKNQEDLGNTVPIGAHMVSS